MMVLACAIAVGLIGDTYEIDATDQTWSLPPRGIPYEEWRLKAQPYFDDMRRAKNLLHEGRPGDSLRLLSRWDDDPLIKDSLRSPYNDVMETALIHLERWPELQRFWMDTIRPKDILGENSEGSPERLKYALAALMVGKDDQAGDFMDVSAWDQRLTSYWKSDDPILIPQEDKGDSFFNILLASAFLFAGQNDARSVLVVCSKAFEVKKYKDDPLLNFYAGDACYRIGRLEEAQTHLNKAKESENSTISKMAATRLSSVAKQLRQKKGGG